MSESARVSVIVVGALVLGAAVIGASWRHTDGTRAHETGGPRSATVSSRPVAMSSAMATPPVSEPGMPSDAEIARLRRGSYLMMIGGCNDCHTPKDEKGQPMAGYYLAGHPADAPLPKWDPSMLKDNVLATMNPHVTAFAGPWGVSVAPNLTPDEETGIGRMTADDLIKSWRENKHWKFDRPILPPMPAPGLSAMTDDDVRALFAFLMTLPKVKNKAPDSIVAPPPGAPADTSSH